MRIEVRKPVEILHKLIELMPTQQVSNVDNRKAPTPACSSKSDMGLQRSLEGN